jgi:hypothetical protein
VLELEFALALTEGGMCAELVDIPVGDTGAVVFSFRSAFPAVTFFARRVGLTPVAFTPVVFPEVVVVPLVVVGIIVFPIIVLFVGTKPLVGKPPVEEYDVDEFVLFCCADTFRELLMLTNTITMKRLVTAYVTDTFLGTIVITGQYNNSFNGYSL